MLPGWSNCSSANLISLWIFQVLVSKLVNGVVPVMWDNVEHLTVVCQSVCLDLKWIKSLWYFPVLTLELPCISAYVCVLDNFMRCTHLCVMKCDWEALSNNAMQGTYWPDLFWTSTMAMSSKIWFLFLPLNEHYVLTSAVEVPLATAGPLVTDHMLLIDWFCLCFCSKVWCYLWHWRHTYFENVWFLVNGCKQLKQSPDCLACLKRCLACTLRNLSHLNNLRDPLTKENCSCVATLEQDLLTLFPVNCD